MCRRPLACLALAGFDGRIWRSDVPEALARNETDSCVPPLEAQRPAMHGRLAQAPFRPRWPWISADLQTVRNFLPRSFPGVPPHSGERMEIPLRDGSGDRLAARFHAGPHSAPAVILIPGLTGCDGSPAVLQAAGVWLRHGAHVLRLNLRGAPPGAAIAGSLHHMDRVGDLADACEALAGREADVRRHGIFLVGFSLGGALALRLAASSMLPEAVRAVVSISAPLDFEAAADSLARRRNRLYERWLLRRLMDQSRHVWQRAPAPVRDALARARHIRDFDEALISGIAGYRGAREYYAACSPLGGIDAIRIPSLILHADDDPWVPPPAMHSRPPVHVAISRGGGHVGFHGRGSRIPWHLRVASAFLRGIADPQTSSGDGSAGDSSACRAQHAP